MSKSYFQTDAVSSSAMKQLLQSPAHYKAWKESNALELPSDALRFGTALHMMILEPHKVETDLRVWVQTKSMQSVAAVLQREAEPDVTFVTVEEWEALRAMQKRFVDSPHLRKLLERCDLELPLFGSEVTSDGEIPAKALLDAVCDRYIIDLKTTGDLATAFPYSAKKYRYPLQAAWYRHRAYEDLSPKQRDFYFIVFEKKPPYGIMVYQVSDETFATGDEQWMRGVELFASCHQTREYPCYDVNQIQTL